MFGVAASTGSAAKCAGPVAEQAPARKTNSSRDKFNIDIKAGKRLRRQLDGAYVSDFFPIFQYRKITGCWYDWKN